MQVNVSLSNSRQSESCTGDPSTWLIIFGTAKYDEASEGVKFDLNFDKNTLFQCHLHIYATPKDTKDK